MADYQHIEDAQEQGTVRSGVRRVVRYTVYAGVLGVAATIFALFVSRGLSHASDAPAVSEQDGVLTETKDLRGGHPAPAPSIILGQLGADRDAHGCIPSAGYSWCAAMEACIRPWEHGIRTEEDLTAKCTPKASLATIVPGSDRDAHGCIPSAGYSWCAAMEACIRPWEHGIRTKQAFMTQCETPARPTLLCNCPPAEVLYQCTPEEYKAVMNGTTCAFYRHRSNTPNTLETSVEMPTSGPSTDLGN